MYVIFPLIPKHFPLRDPGNVAGTQSKGVPSCLGFVLGSAQSLSSWLWSTCILKGLMASAPHSLPTYTSALGSCFQFPGLTGQLPYLHSCTVSALGWRAVHFPTFLTPIAELSALVTKITLTVLSLLVSLGQRVTKTGSKRTRKIIGQPLSALSRLPIPNTCPPVLPNPN